VLQPGSPAARGHLRLAGPPSERRRVSESRAALLLRAALATAVLVLSTAVALAASALALLPVALRRAPVGVRLRPIRQREARVIPFQRPAARKALLR
jgi:hypothetical protein